MTAIDIRTGKEIWRTNRHHVRESMGASPDGSLIYAKLMEDTIIAVSALENMPVTVWKTDAGFGYEHNPCPVTVTEKQVIAGTRDGMIISIDPVTKAVLWKYKAGTSSVNKIVTDSKGISWFTLMEGKIVGIKTIRKLDNKDQ
jgi:outer membrane protein assembly factor BamB